MNYSSFYYERLSSNEQRIYNELNKWFKDEKKLPFEIRIKGISEQSLAQAYEALFLDSCDSTLPPLKEIELFVQNEKGAIFLRNKTRYKPFTKEELFMANEVLRKARKTIQQHSSTYARVIEATRFLHSHGVYLLGNKLNGESPANFLLYHSAYCTGIARTTKLLVDNGSKNGIICVRGYLKKEFSIVSMPNEENTPHMWCAFFDESQEKWMFFDPTSSVRIANKTKLEDEIYSQKYRNDYSNGKYRNISFYTLKNLKKKYILKELL